MDLSPIMKVALVPVIWSIEFFGFLIKHGVLAVRLFANMMGGHTVIAVLLLYIATTATSALWYLVVPSSIFGQIFVGTLEILVAFIQAYIFAFLATLFISMAVNPH
jgi:F-type H+-transporting ATPase subunit a